VDVGCGAGGSLSVFQSQGWVGVGIEPSERTGDYARAQGMDVRAEPYTRTSLDPASVDMIYSYHSLEHFDHPFQAISDFAFHLRGGGILYLECPNILDTTWRQLGYDHHGMFSPVTLSKSLETAGFEIIAPINRRDFPTHGVAFLARRISEDGSTNGHDVTHIPLDQINWSKPSYWKMRVALNYAYNGGRTRDLSLRRFPLQMLHLLVASKIQSPRIKSFARRVASTLRLAGSKRP
jgi:SAM-dependent methyltransferase